MHAGDMPAHYKTASMKKHIMTAAIVLAACFGTSGADTDPVLLSVDGHDIRVSEFEYLYNKNNTQQVQPQTLEQYLQMFVNYKLKVADAEHAGLDTAASFRSELDGFRRELATPYMRDSTVHNRLVQEAYDRHRTDVLVSHIMQQPTPQGRALLDSLRTEILAGHISFEDAARSNSIDRVSALNGGKMGYVTPGRYPYAFELASYTTPVGEITEPVNSGMGYHLIRVENKEPGRGEVLVQHILLLTRGMDSTQVAMQKARIDSLYAVATAPGADFADLAHRFSQDPGTARNGGSLPWFGRGAMVAEFDSAAFAIPAGTVSLPFETRFGYHIINKLDARQIAPMSELRPQIEASFAHDERSSLPIQAVTERLVEQYHGKVLSKAMKKVRKMLEHNDGGYDSVMIATLGQSDLAVATYDDGEPVLLSQIMKRVPVTASTDVDAAMDMLNSSAALELRDVLRNRYILDLARTNTDYRNLLNEYRDGILLYEISNRKVWEYAARDTAGLENYFEANRGRYVWDTPKFKSFIIFAASDSLLQAALEYAPTLSTADPQAFVGAMRSHFGRDVKVERVIAAKGENPITDYLAFDGDKPAADARTRWAAYSAYQGRIIDAPEAAADVRGAVVTDYQAELDRRWIEQLRATYPVHVNQDVFNALVNNARQ